MKTAVSLPDDLFRKAEQAAEELQVSRSQLYATAIDAYLRELRGRQITEKLNQVYATESSALDPALEAAQFESLEHERW